MADETTEVEQEQEAQEAQETMPVINSSEDIDAMLADLSDEEILTASEEQMNKFLEARDNFSNHEETQVEEESQEEKEEEEGNKESSDDKTEDNQNPNLGSVKINGKEVPLNSMEDVQQLLQAGTKYNTLSNKLKPVQRIARMLEKNGLLSDDQVNFAINLLKGNKTAISKLLRDNKIDIYQDLDPDAEYSGVNYKVSDRELQVKETLEEIEAEASYTDTVHAITSMDKASQAKFYNNPDLIRSLNDQVKSGDYATIQKEVERQRALGYLVTPDDFTAYYTVGKQMYFDGKLSSSPQNGSNQKASKAKVEKKRNAASAPKSKGSPKQALTDIDIYNMSDEEILKLDFNKLNL